MENLGRMKDVLLVPLCVTAEIINCGLIQTRVIITIFFAGINEDNSTYNLKNGEIFRTPELALTYSDEGLSGSSRNFHLLARLHKLANGTKLRKILLNSWEGVYFKINEDGMNQMMADIAPWEVNCLSWMTDGLATSTLVERIRLP